MDDPDSTRETTIVQLSHTEAWSATLEGHRGSALQTIVGVHKLGHEARADRASPRDTGVPTHDTRRLCGPKTSIQNLKISDDGEKRVSPYKPLLTITEHSYAEVAHAVHPLAPHSSSPKS